MKLLSKLQFPLFLVLLCAVGVFCDWVTTTVGLSMGYVEVGNALFAVGFVAYSVIALSMWFVGIMLNNVESQTCVPLIPFGDYRYMAFVPVVFSFFPCIHNLLVFGGLI